MSVVQSLLSLAAKLGTCFLTRGSLEKKRTDRLRGKMLGNRKTKGEGRRVATVSYTVYVPRQEPTNGTALLIVE